MDSDEIATLLAGYPGTRLIEANGDVFAIHDPDDDYDQRPRQGWATVVNSDVNDTASDLDRPGVFRLNIGLPKPRFAELFPVAGRARHDRPRHPLPAPGLRDLPLGERDQPGPDVAAGPGTAGRGTRLRRPEARQRRTPAPGLTGPPLAARPPAGTRPYPEHPRRDAAQSLYRYVRTMLSCISAGVVRMRTARQERPAAPATGKAPRPPLSC
ncbi:hypothetical protein Ae168Ps1_4844c [Pseudonocardia sp. Ae168_Ps1]|nr:hypothetical protein Ae150APs1_4806c [Pseudonocardia sp. Ae150A_Ps1]OLL82438.1 hypothetical protein Ae168Ps1_4844c [Pseudonocardia sp. Ae168_Ps1]OLL83447.1 hypothetical protein Ae263Ps1_0502 [Pseudonocardia sp. Ae263_Ps1]OLL90513.1 hypothetical protein Ae356Ps1_0410c [Pseudonocardia sp. Ae356_Ps1]